ncbi:class I SAM-dependent methyltransferase [Rubritalea marina]|uniref:class I SAM-dependent methyltransferase n=1 Tax=Rubritalea marina TaxID=361055 RepID=UPI0003640AD6|nr:SAM-dependent methyltransferase [Rubritalea marina]
MLPIHSSANEAEQTSLFYSDASDPATLSWLESQLKDKISKNGSMSFYDWMSSALYHPQAGYYARGASRVGKSGDFFTSVSVGSVFGTLLAERIAKLHQEHSAGSPLNILELGANTGHLALDVLNAIQAQHPELYHKVQYIISEPLESMRQEQTRILAAHADKLLHVALDALPSLPDYTIFLSNELLDAFPVRLIQYKQSKWCERVVNWIEDSFQWDTREIRCTETLAFTDTLGQNFSDGYTTEFRPELEKLSQTLAQAIEHGAILCIDYGYAHSELYAPHRVEGTLRCFNRHQANDNPLTQVGEQDITAHVDFTNWAKVMNRHGFTPSCFERQSSYFSRLGAAYFNQKSSEGQPIDPSEIRQFQTLTHPSMLGSQFFVLEACKGASPSTTAMQRLELDS